MKRPSITDSLVYTLVILLSLAALLLVLNAPANFLNVRVIYQGF